MAEGGIHKVPVELVRNFCEFMDPVTLSKFSQTCTGLYTFLFQERRAAAKIHAGLIEKNHEARMKVWKRDRRETYVNSAVTASTWMADDDGPDEGPLSYVVLAIHEGRVDALKGYLDAGVDPNSTWGSGRLLGEAACFKNMDCVKALLGYGADPSLEECLERPLEGFRTPLHRAWNMVFQRFYRIGFGTYNEFFSGKWNPEYDPVSRLIKAGVNFNYVYEAAFVLIQQNALEVLQLAVEHGCDLSRLIQTDSSENILHFVVIEGGEAASDDPSVYHPAWIRDPKKFYFRIFEWLITLYPDLANAANVDGMTPYHYAVRDDINRPDMARLMLNSDA